MEQSKVVLHEDLTDLEYKVANIANYFGNQGQLAEHINEVSPNLAF